MHRGDFNVTKFPCEQSDNCRLRLAMLRFSKLIYDMSLVDLSFIGGAYTWYDSHTWSRVNEVYKILSKILANLLGRF